MSKESVKRLSKRTWVAVVLVALVLPAVLIACSSLFWQQGIRFTLFGRTVIWRVYYGFALIIIVAAMIPFFLIFEKRKPQARELVVIATLVAIAVVGRGAFFFLPFFKPVCAIAIIAAVCFGPESGFLVGALSGFVSNFFFGQSDQTPWQMFCFGLVGFVAGLLFRKGLLKADRLPLCIYGGLGTFLLYGGIINFGSALTRGVALTPEMLLASYASALIPDLIHAGATVVFLLILAKPMMEKLERIKTKYGIIEA